MSRVVDLRHVKEPQTEIRASKQNLSDFSRSMSEATLMTYNVKKCRKTQQQQNLKRSDKIPGAPTWRWGEWIWLTEPSGLHLNS